MAASRFFNNQCVTVAALTQALVDPLRPQVEGRDVLAIQDTSEINYAAHSGRLRARDAELGPVGNNRDVGFFLHPSLVLDAKTGFALGFGAVHLWNRRWDKEDKHARSYKRLSIEQKESYRWIETARQSHQALSKARRITHIADREADIYEEFALVPDAKNDLLIRSRCDRRVRLESGQESLLYQALEETPLGGFVELEVKDRPHRKARQARLEVRFCRLALCKPQTGVHADDVADQVWIYVVELREGAETVPVGEKPILWRLLTTHVVETLARALEMASWYRWRWQIEQLFRLLKSQGLRLETSQLEQGSALKKLCLFSLHVALVVLQLVTERAGELGVSASLVFGVEAQVFLAVLQRSLAGKTKKQQCRHAVGSLAWGSWIIGRLGGWKGYASESPPGPVTMVRGLDRFLSQYAGWQLAQQEHGYS